MWKVLRGFTIFVTIGMVLMVITLPYASGDSIPTSIIFTFAPLFYGLEFLGIFDVQNYGMGSIAMLVTIPVGFIWVLCCTSLLLFGPGKSKAAISSIYRTFRKIAIPVGFLYLLLTIVVVIFAFIR